MAAFSHALIRSWSSLFSHKWPLGPSGCTLRFRFPHRPGVLGASSSSVAIGLLLDRTASIGLGTSFGASVFCWTRSWVEALSGIILSAWTEAGAAAIGCTVL
ncbi:hypothetical protein F441_22069 [Phytophthora nicotianae CJ01A1]|uniref:Uncharacterized protein n=3 Tax=Phytophthora nicotianae TaxID=4792 RepID=V9DV33_PHYNI|nr:hypothetical protein F443_22166 [Phytophthora nicotianae P1569]ETP00520.1 hypothetical protein F441_22069 [Phytophthora nicotianae CJ01A1]ETP28675.1 hypothetical protein F442_22040 [Phytophthora nicotianae P10297]